MNTQFCFQWLYSGVLPSLSLPPSLPPSLPSSHTPTDHYMAPCFYWTLVLDQEGAHYSSDPDDFKTTLLAVFDRGILTTHTVPHIDKVTAVFHFENSSKKVGKMIVW